MKITIVLDTDVAAEKSLLASWLGADVGTPKPINTPDDAEEHFKAKEKARELHDDKKPEEKPEDDEPAPRAYGEAPEGKKRRTKAEIEQDEAIEKLFEQAKKLGAAGLPKSIPADPADYLLDELTTMIEIISEAPMDDDDDGFEVGDDDTEPMDLDEFRATLGKGVKALGGKGLGEIMKPYKSATDVPEDERAKYAEAITAAL